MKTNKKSNAVGIICLIVLLAIVGAFMHSTSEEATYNNGETLYEEDPQSQTI